MRFSKRSSVILILSLVVIVTAVWFATANTNLFRSEADLRMAGDLSALSGLSQEEVLRLYDSVGSWDPVRQNIFIYKRIIDAVKQDTAAYDKVFDLAGKYEAGDMLTVYEYLGSNAQGFTQTAGMLKQHADGTSLDGILAGTLDTKTYKQYQPATEEQVRAWMNSGYSPQDIINADTVAKAKDLQIAAVLTQKTQSTTWEQIGTKLGHKFKKLPDTTVTLNVKGDTGTRSVFGKDYQDLIKAENAKSEKDKTLQENKICQELGFTAAQLAEYKSQGLTIHDLQNAARLAKKPGVSMDKILQSRKDGQDWETIIRTYSG